ncbi:hypothetical protein Barb6XT_00414 [Bacteroidales bacterium Barb6XT]|nr:hypothetical protein Barb6XT_00414 [Bacteroidales bacterium Barb6XT]
MHSHSKPPFLTKCCLTPENPFKMSLYHPQSPVKMIPPSTASLTFRSFLCLAYVLPKYCLCIAYVQKTFYLRMDIEIGLYSNYSTDI